MKQTEERLQLSEELYNKLSGIKSSLSFAYNNHYLYGPFHDIFHSMNAMEKMCIIDEVEENEFRCNTIDEMVNKNIKLINKNYMDTEIEISI